MKERWNRSFQGLRGYAIILIVTSHYGYFIRDNNGNGVFGSLGALGVSIFLVISGYLSMLYSGRWESLSVVTYTAHKIKKFYPLHIFTFMLYFIPIIKTVILNWKMIVVSLINLLLLQSWIPRSDVYFSFNGVSWYLSVTVTLSLLTSIVVKCLSKRTSITRLASIVICFVLLEFIWAFFTNKFAVAHWLVYICPIIRLIDFILGGVLI